MDKFQLEVRKGYKVKK